MSAILSADDLNDFISPGVACIKPVESLPQQEVSNNPYEVTTEEKAAKANPVPAQISLTDCLACSGCVTSAEAVLVSLQSHTEVLNVLESHPPLDLDNALQSGVNGGGEEKSGKIFVASVSPQVRASLAATYGISERKAGYMIDQFLSGPHGLRKGGKHNNGFTWVVDTNRMREACLELAAEEVQQSLASIASDSPKRPVLTSACPGWICYAEKTHPHVLPHLSRLKSPQALTGTLLKSVLCKKYGIHPSQIWHVALMPCFDKKLEASREELTDVAWHVSDPSSLDHNQQPVRDVDCVITTRELLTLASARDVTLSSLPLVPIPRQSQQQFPDSLLLSYLFSSRPENSRHRPSSGPSGGYLAHILSYYQQLHPNSTLKTTRGRNADVLDYTLVSPTGEAILKCARYYGFRNIQNLVRKLKPAKTGPRLPGAAVRGGLRRPGGGAKDPLATEYAYVEVMACPGGCTNGGGQIRIEDIRRMNQPAQSDFMADAPIQISKPGPQEQKNWLAKVDEAYFSASGSDSDPDDQANESSDIEMLDAPLESDSQKSNGMSDIDVPALLSYWSSVTNVSLEKLAYTTFRAVESDVGKNKAGGDIGTERVVELAGRVGGGW